MSEHEKRLREYLALRAADLLPVLDAALSSARDSGLEEAAGEAQDVADLYRANESGGQSATEAEQRIRALQSAPVSVVRVEKVREEADDLRDTAEEIASVEPENPAGLIRSTVVEFARRLGVDLDAAGGDAQCPTGPGVPCEPVPDEPERCVYGEHAMPGKTWTGEKASVENDLLPARNLTEAEAKAHMQPGEDCMPGCPACAEGQTRKGGKKHRIYDEPAPPPKPPGTCKGCDAHEDAPPKKHRFSCTVYGKRRVRTTADVSDQSGKKK